MKGTTGFLNFAIAYRQADGLLKRSYDESNEEQLFKIYAAVDR